MASPRLGSPAPQEETPLLDPGRDGESQPADEEARTSEDELLRQQPRVQSLYRSSYILVIASLVLAVLAWAFNIATWLLLNKGGSRYGFYDFRFDEAMGFIFWSSVITILFSIANIYRLKRSGKPIEPGLNVIVFGVLGAFILATIVQVIGSKRWDERLHCREFRGGPGHWDPPPGTVKECQRWAAVYVPISWTWLALCLTVGVVDAALAIISLVVVYRLRPFRHHSSDSSSRWTLPAGQLSVEVAIRWGAPRNEAAVGARSTERPSPTREAPAVEEA